MARGIKSMENFNDTIGNQTRDPLVCSTLQNKKCHHVHFVKRTLLYLGQYSVGTNRYVYIHCHGNLYLSVFKNSPNFVSAYAE